MVPHLNIIGMENYTVVRVLGEGAYGEVLQAVHNTTGDRVAIKVIKKSFATWEECLKLRELKSLKKLRHPNIVRLLEVIRDKRRGQLWFVFEFMESDLYKVLTGRRKALELRRRHGYAAAPRYAITTRPNATFAEKMAAQARAAKQFGGGGGGGANGGGANGGASSHEMLFHEDEIRVFTAQLLAGLAHMHRHGFFHRDVKPENILCSEDRAHASAVVARAFAARGENGAGGGGASAAPPLQTLRLKFADFGTAREIRSLPPYTEYVGTRWYRAPEALLGSRRSSSPVARRTTFAERSRALNGSNVPLHVTAVAWDLTVV